MKNSPQHIAFARLADLIEGRLPSAEAAGAREHLAGCTRCARQAEQLERLTTLMRSDRAEDAPRDVLFSAVQMFRARPRPAEEPGLLRRVLAVLRFDSSGLTPALGVRSGQFAPARQLLFSAGDVDVDVRLAPGGQGWTVTGQVLGPCQGGRVELGRTGEEPAARAELNDLCEFTLPPVPAGSYTLRLRLGDVEVELPELELNA